MITFPFGAFSRGWACAVACSGVFGVGSAAHYLLSVLSTDCFGFSASSLFPGESGDGLAVLVFAWITFTQKMEFLQDN